jgi:hypothetical protein
MTETRLLLVAMGGSDVCWLDSFDFIHSRRPSPHQHPCHSPHTPNIFCPPNCHGKSGRIRCRFSLILDSQWETESSLCACVPVLHTLEQVIVPILFQPNFLYGQPGMWRMLTRSPTGKFKSRHLEKRPLARPLIHCRPYHGSAPSPAFHG